MYVFVEYIFVHNLPTQLVWSTLYKLSGFIPVVISLFAIDMNGTIEYVKAKKFLMF